MTPDPPFLALLQFADGLFPAGGFAHSFGLETYAQEGRVRECAGLEAFVRAHLEGSAGPCDAVAVAHAARRAAAGEIAATALDRAGSVPEFRAASRQMGRQTLRVAAGLGDDPIVGELRHLVEEGRAPGHHAVALGSALGRAGADAERAAAAYLYSTAALLVGAGLRLIALGQLDGQRVLAAVRPLVARLAGDAVVARVEDMWSFTPGLELAGLRHAALDRRLFRS